VTVQLRSAFTHADLWQVYGSREGKGVGRPCTPSPGLDFREGSPARLTVPLSPITIAVSQAGDQVIQ
jgi:hypothetical protein